MGHMMGEGETSLRFLFTYSQMDGCLGSHIRKLREDIIQKSLHEDMTGSLQRPLKQPVSLEKFY